LPSASTEPEQVSSACNDQLMILSSLLVLDNLFILVPLLEQIENDNGFDNSDYRENEKSD
jgi:hypothetical protein